MSSPAILQGGYVLPLSRSFTQLLLGIVAQKPPHRHPITGLTINFRDPEYSPEKGGWHPVEIRLIQSPSRSPPARRTPCFAETSVKND